MSAPPHSASRLKGSSWDGRERAELVISGFVRPLRRVTLTAKRSPQSFSHYSWSVPGVVLTALACLAVAGCARPTGDFGRAAPSVLHDELMPALGTARA